jgi:hypothetical protein
MKYEYKVANGIALTVGDNTSRIEKNINKLAADGWRVVPYNLPLGNLIFERELVEPDGTRWDGERFLSLDGKQRWDGKEWKKA